MRESGASRGEAEWAGVLLHGRERTKAEMMDLAARLNLEGIRWLAPAAETGKWYPGRYMDIRAANEPNLTRAVQRCHSVVQYANEEGRIPPERIIIAGFSQGACLGVEYVLRHPDQCGVLIVFTGCLIGPPGTVWRTAGAKSLEGLHVLITGSDIDDWVAEDRVRETAKVLGDLGADVRLRIYKGRPHVVSEEEIVEARSFIEHLLQPAP
jgi:phospholipase/carboxylesterase